MTLDSNKLPKPDWNVSDQEFMGARASLLSLAAYLDRIHRHDAESDFRNQALESAVQALAKMPRDGNCTKRLLESFSDHSTKPLEVAPKTAAVGAPLPPQ